LIDLKDKVANLKMHKNKATEETENKKSLEEGEY
jgi:hypothetical protein